MTLLILCLLLCLAAGGGLFVNYLLLTDAATGFLLQGDALLYYGILAVLVLVLALMVMPVLTQLLPALRDQVPNWMASLNQWLDPWARRWGVSLAFDVDKVRGMLQKAISGGHDGVISMHEL